MKLEPYLYQKETSVCQRIRSIGWKCNLQEMWEKWSKDSPTDIAGDFQF